MSSVRKESQISVHDLWKHVRAFDKMWVEDHESIKLYTHEGTDDTVVPSQARGPLTKQEFM